MRRSTSDDVPVEVAIDEAVELTKEYCGADAPGFVNGVLGRGPGGARRRRADGRRRSRVWRGSSSTSAG